MSLSAYGLMHIQQALDITGQKREAMIAESAYYRALNHGFRTDPLQDWLEAETEIDQMLQQQFIQKFQAEVMQRIQELEKESERHLKDLFKMYTDLLWIQQGPSGSQDLNEFDMIKKVKQFIGPLLRPVSNDAREIAEVITPALVPLSLTETLPLPFLPVFFAVMSIIVSRFGIERFYSDTVKSEPYGQ